jgi:hypothetical protein
MRIPKPEKKWVVLWSDALGRPSRHHYARTDEIECEDDFDPQGRWARSFAHVFRCAESGAERRYGLESVRIRKKYIQEVQP